MSFNFDRVYYKANFIYFQKLSKQYFLCAVFIIKTRIKKTKYLSHYHSMGLLSQTISFLFIRPRGNKAPFQVKKKKTELEFEGQIQKIKDAATFVIKTDSCYEGRLQVLKKLF